MAFTELAIQIRPPNTAFTPAATAASIPRIEAAPVAARLSLLGAVVSHPGSPPDRHFPDASLCNRA
ncbi:hypothetical protein GCM10007977_071270 [Dactylosporangium sucinum]|uniref:Uncharacterized protein n=1 Tax=Dactylosporangium sucinum TaxID=1424081 RepID=A0A917X376_9ACTN|nr:hypothetical protein GCM10007977_071270 [Dactylosporangium sucinum]